MSNHFDSNQLRSNVGISFHKIEIKSKIIAGKVVKVLPKINFIQSKMLTKNALHRIFKLRNSSNINSAHVTVRGWKRCISVQPHKQKKNEYNALHLNNAFCIACILHICFISFFFSSPSSSSSSHHSHLFWIIFMRRIICFVLWNKTNGNTVYLSFNLYFLMKMFTFFTVLNLILTFFFFE